MITVTTLKGKPPNVPCAVALGYFDGLHIGHRAVIRKAKSYQAKGLNTCVFSFSTTTANPESGKGNQNLITLPMKERLLRRMGVDYIYVPDFTEFKDLEPEQFVKRVLQQKLCARVVCCGVSFRFGKGARGDVKLLEGLCNEYGITLHVVPDVLVDGETVSTTRIRTLLEEGETVLTAKLLGRPFSYDYPVIAGRHIGRTLDFPTINQQFSEGMFLPRKGVYASYVTLGSKRLPGVTNIGVRPTIEGGLQPNSETYIIGYTGDLYGKRVEVHLIKYLREEQRFETLQALKDAIASDTAAVQQNFDRWLKEVRQK